MNNYQPFIDNLLESINSGIMFVDQEDLITFCNKKLLHIVDKPGSEVIGASVNHLLSNINVKNHLQMEKSNIGQKIWINGSVYMMNWHSVRMTGQAMGGLLIFNDISEHEELKKSLDYVKKLNKQLDSIINSSFDGIYIADGDGKGVKVNQAYERITGVKPEELLGKNMNQVVEEGIVSESVTLKVITTKKPVTIVQNVREKEVLVTGNPVFDENEKLLNIVTNIRDISELNQLKKDLEKMRALSDEYYSKLIELQNNRVETNGLIAQSDKMNKIIELTKRVALYDSSILILGESGVGKELIARMVHETSNRRQGPFIKVNCGAIPHQLLESELFGYEGGAFTGANKRGKPGLFELADKGTIFLDEVGELALDLQVKLLRAVQELEITRVGGTKAFQINVRIISATNQNLEQMIEEKMFRKDLYYRLNIVPIKVPSLRERKSDIIPLTHYFLHKFNQKYGMNKKFSHDALVCLKSKEWLGNVRELENCIERLVVMNEGNLITLEQFPDDVKAGGREIDSIDVNRPLKEIMNEVEKEILYNCIKKFKTTRKTAEVLGVDQSTLVRKMQRLRLTYPRA